MPAHIRHFLHHNDVTGTEAVGTNFALSTVHAHDLNDGEVAFLSQRNYIGIVDTVQVVLTSVSGASKVTMRLTEDAAGDIIIIPDTEATLAVGLTTGTTGCAVFKADTIIRQDLGGPGNGTFYLFVKVDAGSAVFAGSQITWKE